VNRIGRILRDRVRLLLLPLSVIPFIAAGPAVMASHDRYLRKHKSGALAAPVVGLSPAEQQRFTRLPVAPGQVPALVWHGIRDGDDGVSTTQRAFARHIALLKHLGYTAISTRQWSDFRAGRPVALPPRPILLTFDDGWLDAYRGADKVLARNDMRAAMFVITGATHSGDPDYLTWSELHGMQKSGRWDIEPHAAEGHRQVTTAPDGAQAPFYAARKFTRSQGRESLADWERRVGDDLFALRKTFESHGITPHAFAVPYSDYGQIARNDPAIPGLLGELLTRQFGSFFVQSGDASFTTPGRGPAQRFELRSGIGLDQLYTWLRRHSPPASRSAPAPGRQAQRERAQRQRAQRKRAHRSHTRHHRTKKTKR
jgi:hypothetical protein